MLVKFEQNRMSKLHEILSFLTKKKKKKKRKKKKRNNTKQNKTKQKNKKRVFKNHFWQSVDASLEDVSVAKGRQFFVVWN